MVHHRVGQDDLGRDIVTIVSAVPGNGFLLGVPPDSSGVGGPIEAFPDNGHWRILYFANNVSLPLAEDVFHTFDEKITSDDKLTPPAKADLLGPPDKARLPRFPGRPTIEWSGTNSADLSFIVESQFGQPRVEDSWSESALKFVDAPGKQEKFTIVAPFGVGMQPHRWRIWALNPSGGISISDWREIDFTN